LRLIRDDNITMRNVGDVRLGRAIQEAVPHFASPRQGSRMSDNSIAERMTDCNRPRICHRHDIQSPLHSPCNATSI
jgi:hypothetical protein